jgi:hypothetical protein
MLIVGLSIAIQGEVNWVREVNLSKGLDPIEPTSLVVAISSNR